MTGTPILTVEFSGRRRFLLILLVGGMVMLIGRAIHLQVVNRQFLLDKGRSQHISEVPVSAYRGRIMDRHGELLAISTPVPSVWVKPQQFKATDSKKEVLRKLLGLSQRRFQTLTDSSRGSKFVYLRRRIEPARAAQIAELNLPGVYMEREYRRYYPAGEVSSHLVGFTDVDDVGQEGMELAYQQWLVGSPGRKRVVRDGKRHIVEYVENIRSPVPGRDLTLTIDQRLQYLAYRELKAAFIKHRARSASLVMLEAQTGEVLAMVNQPSFNPNSRRNLNVERLRNRAITDVFEPGSTMKPFVVACALDQGSFHAESLIDTSPGVLYVGRNRVRDLRDYGVLDITHILQKSSNVGVSKIALTLGPDALWGCYSKLGFGNSVGVGFPGEAKGRLLEIQNWRPFEQATLSFGYGLSGSALQLARAYTALANDGEMPSASLVRKEQSGGSSRVMSEKTASSVRKMLEQVVTREGTAFRARVPGFRVAGKTGTIKQIGVNGYSDSRYLSVFVGMAPASRPKIVMVVVIEEPSAGDYYGGLVAAPIFSRVMSGTLRLLEIPPDHPQTLPAANIVQDGTI